MNKSNGQIRLFIKPYCGWCQQAMDWLDQRHIAYEALDVTTDAAAWQEMFRLSGQTLAPVIQIDGQVLADFDTNQLEEFWNNLQESK